MYVYVIYDLIIKFYYYFKAKSLMFSSSYYGDFSQMCLDLGVSVIHCTYCI